MKGIQTSDIASIAIHCQKGIESLLATAESEDCCVRNVLHVRDVRQIEDRFDQWAGNLGALQHFESPLSLEHRLRRAPMIRDAILKSLKNLHSSIQAGEILQTYLEA